MRLAWLSIPVLVLLPSLAGAAVADTANATASVANAPPAITTLEAAPADDRAWTLHLEATDANGARHIAQATVRLSMPIGERTLKLGAPADHEGTNASWTRTLELDTVPDEIVIEVTDRAGAQEARSVQLAPEPATRTQTETASVRSTPGAGVLGLAALASTSLLARRR